MVRDPEVAMREFTLEEIRMLVEQEREMDAGTVPFVMLGGHRMAMTPEAMQHFGLTVGQSISHEINMAILKFQIEWLTDKIAEQNAQKISDKEFNAAIDAPFVEEDQSADSCGPSPGIGRGREAATTPLDNESGLS